MHFIFATRGIKQQVDLFSMFMQSQMFMWKRKNLQTNQEEICQVQGALRPIQLWEYVFPEEHLNEVLSMMEINPNNKKYGYSNLKLSALRKMIGGKIDPVPNFKPTPTDRYIEKRGIHIYPIGIKKDGETREFGFDQEKL